MNSGSDFEEMDNHEEARLRALRDLDLLDSLQSESFDRITRMASRLFQAPISAVSLTDRDRQWFKSHVGTKGREIPRVQAPCAEVTRTSAMLVVPDLTKDARFHDSPLANSGVRFYAGAPLITRDGHALGAMCVLDLTPRTLSAEDVKSLQDFAAMVMSQIELEHDLGRVDSMSGLPNRNQLVEDLKDSERDDPGGRRVSLLVDLADPKHFNQVLSVLGPGYIEDLVKNSSHVIRDTLGHKTGIYHFGVTSIVIIHDEAKGQTWRDLVNVLSPRLRSPLVCNGVPVMMNVKFGISPFELGDSRPGSSGHDGVLRTVVSAAHDAREAELDYAVYNPASDEANRRRFTLLTDVRKALKQSDQLTLAYQPKIDLRTEACGSAEALLRWRHPQLGNVSPGEFIPLVEQTALARPVTRWVIDAAMRQVAAWRRTGLHLRVSINVSALNLEELDFAETVAEALQRFGVPPSAVEIEFTESAVIRNDACVLHQLEQVRSMGVELAIDDFGTGYSTFAYLQKIPAHTVKLDQSFMRLLAESRRDQLLVQSMIDISHDLGYRVVAEGVETQEAYDFLVNASCDEVQGYFISRPLDASAFEVWLSQRTLNGLAKSVDSRNWTLPSALVSSSESLPEQSLIRDTYETRA